MKNENALLKEFNELLYNQGVYDDVADLGTWCGNLQAAKRGKLDFCPNAEWRKNAVVAFSRMTDAQFLSVIGSIGRSYPGFSAYLSSLGDKEDTVVGNWSDKVRGVGIEYSALLKFERVELPKIVAGGIRWEDLLAHVYVHCPASSYYIESLTPVHGDKKQVAMCLARSV